MTRGEGQRGLSKNGKYERLEEKRKKKRKKERIKEPSKNDSLCMPLPLVKGVCVECAKGPDYIRPWSYFFYQSLFTLVAVTKYPHQVAENETFPKGSYDFGNKACGRRL